MSNIRKDDLVYVLSGNDKGKTGVVLAMLKDKVIIKDVNVRKKHLKKTQQAAPQVANIEMPIHISNVALCDKDGKKVKAKIKINADKSKDLVCIENGKETTLRKIKKK